MASISTWPPASRPATLPLVQEIVAKPMAAGYYEHGYQDHRSGRV